MKKDPLDGLTPAIRARVAPILANMLIAGWAIGHIDVIARIISFRATSQDGRSVFIACPEKDLPDRLASLLGNPIFFD